MSVKSEPPLDKAVSRELPDHITIPPIDGEMLKLRPAVLEDLQKLDEIDAFHGASKITGKDPQSERAAVQAWVRRSVAWAQGIAADQSGIGDPESRRTIAWTIVIDSSPESTSHESVDEVERAAPSDGVIGMIFLIDIDGWARSARIQVVLGKDYRGRGYSRDAMPRVMTYGFAPIPAGLGMHRIWVAVPEKNNRSLSVYQSLGFEHTGTSRDALWDAENGKYQDLNVLDTLVDEYDPIRSLDAFGMHVIEHNPGVQEALSAREHSLALEQHFARQSADPAPDGQARATVGQTTAAAMPADSRTAADPNAEVEHAGSDAAADVDGLTNRADRASTGAASDVQTPDDPQFAALAEDVRRQMSRHEPAASPAAASDAAGGPGDDDAAAESWPYSSTERNSSKRAWWRNFGRGHKNGKEGRS